MDYNQIKIFIKLEIIGEEDKNKKIISIFKKNLRKLYPCDARLNQNSYVNNYFINLLKINNKNK